MEHMVRLINGILIENWLILITFSLSWVVIILFMAAASYGIPLLTIKLPYSMLSFFLTKFIDFPWKHHDKVKSCDIDRLDIKKIDFKIKCLGVLLRKADEYFYNLHKKKMANIFFSKNETAIIKKQTRIKNLLCVEKYLSMYQTFSEKKELRLSGLLNTIENPMTTEEEKENFLYYVLLCGYTNLKLLALFHILDTSLTYKKLEDIEQAISLLDDTLKEKAQSICEKSSSKLLTQPT